MHLKKIKLAGFKSFVDQTTIHLPNKIAAIVGPNGCGKSNVIDAVRWVMGESSAKQMRGEAMSDVIFNGSTKRKPMGCASIELTFDNSDASIGGEYAQYGEIAVRREIEREGGSDYFLNGARCRRRDIIDVFLGTGLGPNSYAIIEQGTISQFVEAKPDELRLYLEEAAGISKYKDRRRETENRIKHTRENLARLNDIRLELEQQLKHLKSQANAAERYKRLKQEERQTKAEMHALHCRKLQQQLDELEILLKQEEAKLEDRIVEQNNYEAKISLVREEHHGASESFNTIQEKFYRVGADIARLEQQLQHEKERRKNFGQELAKLEQIIHETVTHQKHDRGQLNILQEELGKITNDQPGMAELLKRAEDDLRIKESATRNFQQEWDIFKLEISSVERSIDVEQTKVQHTQQTIINEEQRLHKLREELAHCKAQNHEEEIANLEKEYQTMQKDNQYWQEQLTIKQQEIGKQREEQDKLLQELDAARHKLQILAGKYASLEALQEAALGKSDVLQKKWLQEKQIADKPRLLQELKVESGWEKAIEVVMASYLEAICIDDLNITKTWQQSPESHLMLFDGKGAANRIMPGTVKMATLVDKITATHPIGGLLAGIYVADDLTQALSQRTNLEFYESIVTKDGIWLGCDWLCMPGKSEPKSGIIQRERELKEIKALLQEQQYNVAARESEQQQQQALVVTLQQQYHEIQQKLHDVTASLGKIQGEINAKQQHAVYLQQRYQSLQQEVNVHENIVQEAREKMLELQQIWQAATSKKMVLQEKQQTMQQRQQSIQNDLNTARELVATQRQAVNSNTLRLEMLKTQVGYLQNNLERAEKKVAEFELDKMRLQQDLVACEKPIVDKEQEMHQMVAERFKVDENLQRAKQLVSERENALRELESKRTLLQETTQILRDKLEKIRLEALELKTRKENHVIQIVELNCVLDELLSQIPVDASLELWEEKITQIITRIDRLGPINLAAIEECTKQAERKEYLDRQNQDLVDALTTLEGAIHKIDQETKEKFHEIFTAVNRNFQEIFPRVFNGGQASLQLMEDNLLESGVAIFAQPPGKRNSSIHLLSGGEKALTAISLVFAIFQLNPAPFCMLDEVDAPLDDANVIRFCNLVKEIAQNVQLIFISHNKLTLEIADQLTGVTMLEPGVSRIVDVDVQKALELVDGGRA